MDKRQLLKSKLNAMLMDGQICAKWQDRKGINAVQLRNYLGLTPKAYRKLLVGLTNVVESKMCAKEWDSINFEQVPSVASSRYQKAFGRNAPSAYTSYIEAVQKGEKTIHAGAVFPYDIVRSVRHGDASASDEQWKALPDFVPENANVLPLVDVSGSMQTPVSGSIQAIDVAISLGIYLAQRQKGAFKDLWCTFSQTPKLEKLKGDTLSQVISNMEQADWGMNTNLEAAFTEILRVATKYKVPQEEMPKTLIVFSDMQFDSATRTGYSSKKVTAQDSVRQQYEAAGYNVPSVIYWNLNGQTGNVPVT